MAGKSPKLVKTLRIEFGDEAAKWLNEKKLKSNRSKTEIVKAIIEEHIAAEKRSDVMRRIAP